MILKSICQLLALIVCLKATEGFEGCSQKYTDSSIRCVANTGEDAILWCDFDFPENKPVPYIIQWQKHEMNFPIYIFYDGFPPMIGDGYEGRVSRAHQASLNLTNVQESDQGWYVCKMYFLNRLPVSPSNGTWVYLKVLDEVYIITPPRNVTAKVGESVKFICEANLNPSNVTHSWFHDGVGISPLSRLGNRAILGRDGSLTIRRVSREDSGEFACEVKHRIGGTPVTESAHLNVDSVKD